MVEMISLPHADYEALLDALEDAEDHIALLEYALATIDGTLPEPLTIEEAERLIQNG